MLEGNTRIHAGALTLGFAGQQLALTVDQEAAGPAAPVLEFVQPHFSIATAPAAEAAVQVDVLPLDRWHRPDDAGTKTLVRKARTADKHLWGTIWRSAGRTILWIESSRTAFDLADDGSQARVFISEGSRYHLSDFLRDIFWELAEAGGTGSFVHAAAVCGGEGVIAFTGDKGAGKTTTALDFVHAGAEFYSGDVLFMDPAGAAVYSFPDYPGVCWGTIRAYPRLLEAAVGLNHVPSPVNSDKILLPHDIYLTALGVAKAIPPLPLRAVILADVSAAADSRLEATEPRQDLLEPMLRQTSDPDEGWEPFLREVRGQAVRTEQPSSAPTARPDVPWTARRGLSRLPQQEIVDFLARTRQPSAGVGR